MGGVRPPAPSLPAWPVVKAEWNARSDSEVWKFGSTELTAGSWDVMKDSSPVLSTGVQASRVLRTC